MKPRSLSKVLHKVIKTFPAIVVTGPRQSGKTTLLKHEFGKTHRYFNLENPDIRLRAKSDPIGFLNQITTPVIFDEIQYIPELLPYIKSRIDNNRVPGQWLLTGSQQFSMMQNISESLAGRAAILSLLPFSLSEIFDRGSLTFSVNELFTHRFKQKDVPNIDIIDIILRGSYPEIISNASIERSIWYGSYIVTYLERDIRNISQVGDLSQFEIFLRALASRTGQILDLSAISREIGVSFTTAKRWLSLLQTGYQVFLLYPYYKNIGKRLVKRPKIYLADTGLASYLLGIHTKEALQLSSLLGPLFETLVVTDFWKRFLHHGDSPLIHYLKTQDKLEIDMVTEQGENMHLTEIKSSSTIRPEHGASLIRAHRDLKIKSDDWIISNTADLFRVTSTIQNIPVSYLTL